MPRRYTDEEMVKALRLVGTLSGAARILGCGLMTIRHRAEKSPKVKRALDARARGKVPHPSFVQMKGKTVGAWLVLSRAPNRHGNARWKCRHACGAIRVIEGIQLRKAPPRCQACRAESRRS